MSSTAWYLVHSKPSREEVATTNLKRQGYEVFLPRMRVQARARGRYVARVEAMFPRYLFVRLAAEEQDWSPIRSTVGVSTLVRFGLKPGVVPEDLVNDLRSRCDEAGIVADLVPDELTPGKPVRVVEGLLEGYCGIIQATSGQERVHILLDLVGKQASATLSPHQVAAV
ncbi:MAG: transcriptional activator RfaH [Halofilum sp. (in: g-proteobacteria)]